ANLLRGGGNRVEVLHDCNLVRDGYACTAKVFAADNVHGDFIRLVEMVLVWEAMLQVQLAVDGGGLGVLDGRAKKIKLLLGKEAQKVQRLMNLWNRELTWGSLYG